MYPGTYAKTQPGHPAVIMAGLAAAAGLLYAAAYVVGAGLKASGALG